jgi:hypothetical protein
MSRRRRKSSLKSKAMTYLIIAGAGVIAGYWLAGYMAGATTADQSTSGLGRYRRDRRQLQNQGGGDQGMPLNIPSDTSTFYDDAPEDDVGYD